MAKDGWIRANGCSLFPQSQNENQRIRVRAYQCQAIRREFARLGIPHTNSRHFYFLFLHRVRSLDINASPRSPEIKYPKHRSVWSYYTAITYRLSTYAHVQET